jgi:hypothetical protein
MFDLDAPIIPGQSAAGVHLGDSITELLEQIHPQEIFRLHGGKRYNFGSVALWEKDGKIKQIGLFAGYRGTLAEGIGIGSTIGDIKDKFGAFVEDEEDNLVVKDVPGWCFETEAWLASHQAEPDLMLRITEIYVFPSHNG